MDTPLSSEEERARKRQAIGLAAHRPTAKSVVQRPPDRQQEEGHGWLAVFVLIILLAGTTWLIYDRERGEDIPPRAAPALSSLLLHDDFRAPQLALAGEHQEGVWATGFRDGVYQIRIDKPGNLTWSTLGMLDLNAYRVETALTLAGPANAAWGYGGLLVRFGNEDNFYLFVVDGRGAYQVQLQEEGTWRVLQPWTQSTALAGQGEENLLAAEDDGSTIRFYANDRLLFTVEAPRLPGGDIGLAAGTRSQGTVMALFDWVKLYAVPVVGQ